ncbi:MAG: DUF4197 domain-containing protein [Saprospiraceae bacterium]
MKKFTFILFCLAIAFNSQAQFGNVLKKVQEKADAVLGGNNPLSADQIGAGLKEALNVGVGEASDFLSTENGYFESPYKILLPEEAQVVTKKLRAVPGFSNIEADLTEKLNRAAEDAANKAKPIFVSAIKQMTIRDAMDLLMGNQDAATRYLEKSTYQKLYDEFRPIIIASLDKVNARQLWNKSTTAYNKLPFVKKTNPELDDYVTKQALVGLFGLVEKKEEDIRTNVGSRSSDLLKQVFAKQDGKQ